MANRILMAQIGAAHGIKGEVRVMPFGDDPMALAGFGGLLGENGVCYSITGLRAAKGTMLVARFKGIDDRSAAEAAKT